MTSDLAGDAIDEAHLDRQTGGDRALAEEVLTLFSEQCRDQLVAIIGVGPLQHRLDAAHTLKGAASAVGASRVALAAADAESALTGDAISARSALAALERAVAEARAAIMSRASRA